MQSLTASSRGAPVPKPPYQTTAKQKRLKYRKLTWRIPRGFSRNWKQEPRPGLWVPAGGAQVGNPLYGRASSAKPQRSAERGAQGSECRARGAARVSPRAQRNPAFPAGALFPSSGSAGVSLSKGIYLWEKGDTLRSWSWWAASVYAGGERGK